MRHMGTVLFGIRGVVALLLWATAPVSSVSGESSVAAFTTNGPPVSLAGAQQMALERNWDLLAAAAGVDAATAQKIVVHEFPNPTLSASASKINVDDKSNATSSGNGVWDTTQLSQ